MRERNLSEYLCYEKNKNFISVSIFVASLITKRPEEEKNWSRKIARNDFQFSWKRIINGNPLQRYGFSPQLFPHMLDHGNRKYIAAKNKRRIIFHSLYRLFKRFLGMKRILIVLIIKKIMKFVYTFHL